MDLPRCKKERKWLQETTEDYYWNENQTMSIDKKLCILVKSGLLRIALSSTEDWLDNKISNKITIKYSEGTKNDNWSI